MYRGIWELEQDSPVEARAEGVLMPGSLCRDTPGTVNTEIAGDKIKT